MMAAGLVSAAVVFVSGVILSLRLCSSFIALFVIIYLLVCLICFLLFKQKVLGRILFIAIFAFAVIITHIYTDIDQKKLLKYENAYTKISGRISELPKAHGENTHYIVDTVSVSSMYKTENIKERILISSKDVYNYGDSVTFYGFVEQIPDKMSEYGFDLKRYYKSKDIFFKAYSQKSEPYDRKINDYSVYALSNSLKNSISQLLDKYVQGDDGAVLKAILTGNKSEFSDEYNKVLTRTGTRKFFYPAFLHISIITYIIGMFSTIIRKRIRDMLIIFLLILYVIAQSSHPVLVKGGLLVIIVTLFKSRKGYVYLPDALSAVILAVGVSNPLMLYDAGFISGIVASILVYFFTEPVSKLYKSVKNRHIKRMLTSATISTIGLIPISAYYFNGISIYSIFTSVVFLPATLGIILVSPFVLVMLMIFHKAPLLDGALTSFIWIYRKIPYFIDTLPMSYIALAKPSLLFIGAFYTGLYSLWMRYRKKYFISYIAVLCAFIFFLIIASGQAQRLNTMEITFVNVGQGDGAVVEVPYRSTVLIDGGGGSEYDDDYNAGEAIFLPYLERKGISRVDCAIVSHSHKDHVEGIIAAMENLKVEHLYLPPPISEIEWYNKLILTAKEYGTQIHIVEEDTVLKFNSGLIIEIFAPIRSLSTTDENDSSLLVRTSWGDINCTFTGDMSKTAEQRFLRDGKVFESEILKVAHHGSNSSSCAEFLNAVSPDTAVISVGENNCYALPSNEVLKRLSGTTIFRTDKDGDIKITADKKNIKKIKTLK